MKIIIGFFIFCLVLFIYLHIQFHLKKTEDLEMYEIDDPSKDKLEEICDIRQPVLFDFDCVQSKKNEKKKPPRKIDSRHIYCFKCERYGHIEEDCIQCETCKKYGHLRNDCRACTYCHEGIHLEKHCWKKNQQEINIMYK